MTIRTFWTILIKILGIWLVLESITVISQFFSALFYIDAADSIVMSIASILMVVGLYIFILWLFVFKTAWLIDKLQLEKGFSEEKMELNIQRSTVLSIAVIVVGGIMFVDSLPQLCKHIFVFFQQTNMFRESPTSGWIIFYLAKTGAGYLLMIKSQWVVSFIERQSKKES